MFWKHKAFWTKPLLILSFVLLVTVCFGQWTVELEGKFYFTHSVICDSVRFGTRIGATENYDHGIDRVDPQYPPTGYYRLDFEQLEPYFLLMDWNFKSESADTLFWELQIRMCCDPIDSLSLFWDPDLIPSDIDVRIGLEVIDSSLFRANGNDSLPYVDWETSIQMNDLGKLKVSFPYYYSSPVHLRFVRTAPDDKIDDERIMPAEFYFTASPNPFNSSIDLNVPDGFIVEIFDISGKIIEKLQKDDNGNALKWHPASECKSGIYLAKASNGDLSYTKRLIFVK